VADGGATVTLRFWRSFEDDEKPLLVYDQQGLRHCDI
jgi:hypothetical protein